jgi:hypothetical protein
MQRRHLLRSLTATALVGLTPLSARAAPAEFEWVHPGGDPYDSDGTQPLLPALHILNKDGFIPPWAVAELEGKMSRGEFFSDSIPDTGDYLFHRMLFSHRKVTVARNVRARTRDARWMASLASCEYMWQVKVGCVTTRYSLESVETLRFVRWNTDAVFPTTGCATRVVQPTNENCSKGSTPRAANFAK